MDGFLLENTKLTCKQFFKLLLFIYFGFVSFLVFQKLGVWLLLVTVYSVKYGFYWCSQVGRLGIFGSRFYKIGHPLRPSSSYEEKRLRASEDRAPNSPLALGGCLPAGLVFGGASAFWAIALGRQATGSTAKCSELAKRSKTSTETGRYTVLPSRRPPARAVCRWRSRNRTSVRQCCRGQLTRVDKRRPTGQQTKRGRIDCQPQLTI